MGDRHKLIYDKITDDMLRKPVNEMTEAEAAMIQVTLAGPYGTALVQRIDRLGGAE